MDWSSFLCFYNTFFLSSTLFFFFFPFSPIFPFFLRNVLSRCLGLGVTKCIYQVASMFSIWQARKNGCRGNKCLGHLWGRFLSFSSDFCLCLYSFSLLYFSDFCLCCYFHPYSLFRISVYNPSFSLLIFSDSGFCSLFIFLTSFVWFLSMSDLSLCIRFMLSLVSLFDWLPHILKVSYKSPVAFLCFLCRKSAVISSFFFILPNCNCHYRLTEYKSIQMYTVRYSPQFWITNLPTPFYWPYKWANRWNLWYF